MPTVFRETRGTNKSYSVWKIGRVSWEILIAQNEFLEEWLNCYICLVVKKISSLLRFSHKGSLPIAEKGPCLWWRVMGGYMHGSSSSVPFKLGEESGTISEWESSFLLLTPLFSTSSFYHKNGLCHSLSSGQAHSVVGEASIWTD